MPYKDKEDSRKNKRKWYRKHRSKEIKRTKKRKEELLKWFIKLKKKYECVKCGENHPACLEFHHIKSENKEKAVYRMVNWGYSKEKIKKEIQKCVPICSNCHKKIHYNKTRN